MTRIIFTSVLALSVTACAVRPQPLTADSVAAFAQDKRARVTAGQVPITGPVTLYEAMARAIKYNLDFHVELYNEVLASEKLRVARLNTLPQIALSAHVSDRDKIAGTQNALFPSDRRKYAEDLALSWNVLDLGLSYVRAQQAANEVLIAEERRRKIINRVIEDVRTAYWRAASADRLVAGLRKLEHRVKKAYNDSVALQAEGEASPLTALTYQRELVEVQQRIQKLEKELSLAKIQLAALMNVKPGTSFKIAQPKRRVNSTKLPLSMDEMIDVALESRPEIRDVQYQMRINAKEARAALLELLPTASIFASANWDSDSALAHNNWLAYGVKATWNAMNVFKYPARKRLIATKDQVLDQRALAITMAIMTQVHVSRVRYDYSKSIYRTASKHLRVQRGIRSQVRTAEEYGQASEQTLIREEMNTLASAVEADIAYAELQNAYANIFASMGLDPYGTDVSTGASLDSIRASLERTWIERGDMSGFVKAHRKARPVASSATVAHGYSQPQASSPTSVPAAPAPAAPASFASARRDFRLLDFLKRQGRNLATRPRSSTRSVATLDASAGTITGTSAYLPLRGSAVAAFASDPPAATAAEAPFAALTTAPAPTPAGSPSITTLGTPGKRKPSFSFALRTNGFEPWIIKDAAK